MGSSDESYSTEHDHQRTIQKSFQSKVKKLSVTLYYNILKLQVQKGINYLNGIVSTDEPCPLQQKLHLVVKSPIFWITEWILLKVTTFTIHYKMLAASENVIIMKEIVNKIKTFWFKVISAYD
jgi:hypothetical protein